MDRGSRTSLTGRSLLLLVVLALLGAAGGYAVASLTPAVYRSTATLLVGDLTNVQNLTKEDLDASAQVAATYGLLMRTAPVLGPAADELGDGTTWQTLRGRVHVDVVNQNALINLTATGSSSEQAQATAEAVISSLEALTPTGGASGDASVGAFAQQRVEELQAEIERLEERISFLRQRRATAPNPKAKATIQQVIDRNLERVTRSQQSLVALANLATSSASPNTLTVLQPPTAPPGRVHPDLKANVAIGGALGVIAALALLALARGRAARRTAAPSGTTEDGGDKVTQIPESPATSRGTHLGDTWAAEMRTKSRRRT
jgi:capsular polysaccharide biosynthesis protein